MADNDRFAVGESFDQPPGKILVFPENSFELAPAAGTDENDFHPELFNASGSVLEGASRVTWAPDRTSPCYSHLLADGGTAVAADKTFTFTKAALELYLAASRYVPHGNGDILVFGLRGARLKGAERFELVDDLPLEDVRPDHFNFRCVIGYYFRTTGKFSAYTGSTVPWHTYMSDGQLKYNLLPTGCYVYKKGAHRPANEDRWVDPAFRLSDANGSDSGPATVLRTPRDTVFDMTDTWDKCAPSDNIHCAYSDEKFSSLGCQTVKGGMHDGLWARFQATIKTLPKNARVDYILLTGAEASIAASFARDGKAASDGAVQRRLGRLRVGSEGDDVQRLQAMLGLPASAYFGAATKKRLTELQKENGLPPDGIFAPAIEAQLGGGIFGGQQTAPSIRPPPAVTVAAPAPPTPQASQQASTGTRGIDGCHIGCTQRRHGAGDRADRAGERHGKRLRRLHWLLPRRQRAQPSHRHGHRQKCPGRPPSPLPRPLAVLHLQRTSERYWRATRCAAWHPGRAVRRRAKSGTLTWTR